MLETQSKVFGGAALKKKDLFDSASSHFQYSTVTDQLVATDSIATANIFW
jgi:hypothetical protein